MKHPPAQDGFSLVELLVTFGVVAILLLIAFPVMTAQVEKSRSALCLMKLRQLSIAVTQFRVERNQKLWDLRTKADGGEGSLTPVRILYSMGLLKDADEITCPSARTPKEGAWKNDTSFVISAEYMERVGNQYASYAVNGVAFYTFSPWYTSRTETSFRFYNGRESKVPLFMDGLAFQLNQTSWQMPMRLQRATARHRNHCNMVFLDGHAEVLTRHELERIDPFGGAHPKWQSDFGID